MFNYSLVKYFFSHVLFRFFTTTSSSSWFRFFSLFCLIFCWSFFSRCGLVVFRFVGFSLEQIWRCCSSFGLVVCSRLINYILYYNLLVYVAKFHLFLLQHPKSVIYNLPLLCVCIGIIWKRKSFIWFFFCFLKTNIFIWICLVPRGKILRKFVAFNLQFLDCSTWW